VSAVLDRRLRDQRARLLIRSFGYRQRHHAHGVWFSFRRVLAGAAAAYVISEDDATTLAAEGCRVEPVGRQLQPPKIIVSVPPERMARVASARSVTVRLGGVLLTAACLGLVPFEEAERQ
jgi:hypothetical protein